MSSTTNSSISLEGKSLWIIKMLPVSTSKIFASKIMVNLTVLLPTAIIVCTFFGIYLKLSLVNFIFTYLISFAYSIFTSVLGLLLNLLFPKFDYDNEVRVIKQSLAVFLSILIGIISVLLPFKVFKGNTDSNLRMRYSHLKDGCFYTIDCIPNYELIRELCSFGKELLVLEPLSVQNEVFNRIQQMYDDYSCIRT